MPASRSPPSRARRGTWYSASAPARRSSWQNSVSNPQPPLVVACGLGVDSTAMLVGFTRRGIRPDLILFADTAGKIRRRYDYRPTLDRYLQDYGLPRITLSAGAANNRPASGAGRQRNSFFCLLFRPALLRQAACATE